MKENRIINLPEFRQAVQESANETKAEFPDLFFDYAGIIPVNDPNFRYDCTPVNTTVFAHTGGDGVHYSILEISNSIQPIIMTVPMNFGDSIKLYNHVLGENLNEFLSLGYYNGWFPLEQICYENEWAIKFYQNESTEDEDILAGRIQFVKKMRAKLGYSHIPLNNDRLKALEDLYFDKLLFKEEFLEMISKK